MTGKWIKESLMEFHDTEAEAEVDEQSDSSEGLKINVEVMIMM